MGALETLGLLLGAWFVFAVLTNVFAEGADRDDGFAVMLALVCALVGTVAKWGFIVFACISGAKWAGWM
jgi:hypothetical protein